MATKSLSLACAALVLAFSGLAAAAEPGGGTREGITVHGHWRIEVVDPDGTVVSTTEFENALTTEGQGFLGGTLGRQGSTGAWKIVLLSPVGGDGPCDDGLGFQTACVISESGAYWAGDLVHSSDLTVASTPTGATLSGSVAVAFATSVGGVETYVKSCNASVPPAACPGYTPAYGHHRFTATTLASPPAVQPGQIVNVTVNLSFS